MRQSDVEQKNSSVQLKHLSTFYATQTFNQHSKANTTQQDGDKSKQFSAFIS